MKSRVFEERKRLLPQEKERFDVRAALECKMQKACTRAGTMILSSKWKDQHEAEVTREIHGDMT